MRAVILAAGYGTRLEKDLALPHNAKYQHLAGVPKPLLPVAGVPLITHWIWCFRRLKPPLSSVTVVVNALHYDRYEAWLVNLQAGSLRVCLLTEGSTSNDTRSGAVECMRLAAAGDLSQHCLVVAGDTLLATDFRVQVLLDEFQRLTADGGEPVSLVVSAPVAEEDVSKHGILEVGCDGVRVTRLLEKPSPEDTPSRLQCPAVYLLHSAVLPLLQDFLSERRSRPLVERDAPGHFIAWLVRRSVVQHIPASGRYDIGSLATYLATCRAFDSLYL